MPVNSVEQKGGSRLRICALGEPAVLIDENPVTRWRMARSMELFFLLLDQSHPLRKEQIIDALWQNYDKQSNRAFHSTLFYLRKAIGEACIVSQGGTYVLDLTAHYASIEYDVELFQKHFARGKECLEQEDEEGAQHAFEAMLALYRGDYIQTSYNDWSSSRRNELRQASLDAHRELALIAWYHEKIATSMKHWQQILASDNTQEEAHYGLMRCYARQGKRSLALRQYQQCEKILQEELGAKPGTTLQQFYQRLKSATSKANKDK
ncbi:AfsR/SARP family transcriptional regulator [Dictyobacter kobayashii]|nr:BTAD domain-containing putative transcriptional regulator [Dictyobacter kobayashii]